MNRRSAVPLRDRIRFNLRMIAEHFVGKTLTDRVAGDAGDPLQLQLAEHLAAQGEARFRDIDRRRDLDPEEFHTHYLRNGIPVILEGAAKDWACTSTWTLDYFRERYGDEPILLQQLEGLAGFDLEGSDTQTTLGEAITEMQEGKATYVRFASVINDHPELQEMLDIPMIEALQNPHTLSSGHVFFLGRSGTTTQLHAALPCNLFVMVHGRKRWTLYPAHSTAALRPPVTRGQYYYSEFEPAAPDTTRFPAMPYLEGYQFDLEEGDILYNPPYMWHYVENLADSIAVSYRFTHLRSSLRASATLTLLRLFAMDPPPWRTLAVLRDRRTLFSPNFKTSPEQNEKGGA